MKRLFLLIGLVVFLTPMVVSAGESNKGWVYCYNKSEALTSFDWQKDCPKNYVQIKKSEFLLINEKGAEDKLDQNICDADWLNKEYKNQIASAEENIFKSKLPKCKKKLRLIKTKTACFAIIRYHDGSRYKGEFLNKKFHGQGTYIWGNPPYVGDKYVGEYKFGKKSYGTYFWTDGDRYVGEWKNDKIHGHGTYSYNNGDVYVGEKQKGLKHGCGTYTFANGDKYVGEWKYDDEHGQGTLSYTDGGPPDSGKWINGILEWNETVWVKRGAKLYAQREQEELQSQYDEFAMALGCGIKRKDVDECVRRHLPATIGTGPLTMEQIEEVKKDEELMYEVVFAIEEMNRQQGQSLNEPTEEEKRQAQEQEQQQAQAQQTEGHYTEQPNGQFVWVDTRSGYEKFTDNFCVGCNATQVYMINRATKKYFQGAPLSGWDKFVLRGGNSRRVIRFY